jgi:hypothetical protein
MWHDHIENDLVIESLGELPYPVMGERLLNGPLDS